MPESNKKANEEVTCTLRSFPLSIENSIDWAKNKFDDYFIDNILKLKEILKDQNKFKNLRKEDNDYIYIQNKYHFMNLLLDNNNESIFQFAIDLFKELYIKTIEKLYIEYPLTNKTFWTKSKIPPNILNLDINDKMISNFIESTIQILSNIKNIKEKVEYKNFKKEELIYDNENENLNNIIEKVNNNSNLINNLMEIKFNKENTTGHIDFIHYCANLRAKQFSLAQCEEIKTFKYVGKIGPTTITSTASIAGYMCMNMISIITNKTIEKIEDKIMVKDYLMNLMDNSFSSSKLNKPIIYKDQKENYNYEKNPTIVVPREFCCWDKEIIDGSKTLQELLDFIKEKYNVDINIIDCYDDSTNIFSKSTIKKRKENLLKKIEVIYNDKNKKNGRKCKNLLMLRISGKKNGVIVEMPKFKYIF